LQSNTADQGVFLSSYITDTSTVYTKLELLPRNLQVVTPAVNSGSASVGQVLTLQNAATGEVDFETIDLSPGFESGNSATIDFENKSSKVYQFDFTGKNSATLVFNNVRIGAVYTIHFLNTDSGDLLTFPANSFDETGLSLQYYSFGSTGKVWTFYFDGTNYYFK